MLSPKKFFHNHPQYFGFWLLIVLGTICSCAGAPPSIQPQINSLVVAGRPQKALKLLEDSQSGYGLPNQLLFFLDKALVLQVMGDYPSSTVWFEKARLKFDELYTQSISKGLATWVINDYADDYHGEDFEHVLVDVFQSLNYALQGNLSEALVDARAVDEKLRLINSQYSSQQKNVYREDAFARLLSGILFESSFVGQDLNDAYIAYARSARTYDEDYTKNYSLPASRVLKENFLSVAKWMGPSELASARERYPDIHFPTVEEKSRQGQIYIIQYNGLAPLKTQTTVPIPLPGGYLTRLAFPAYQERFYETTISKVVATQSSTGRRIEKETELVESITQIAMTNLKNRRIRVYAKAALRPLAKYALERAGEDVVRREYGERTALGFRVASSIFNLYSEQADVRGWQTLPAEIRLTRFLVESGRYQLQIKNFDADQILVDEKSLGEIDIRAGEVKFILVRTVR